MPEQPPRLRLDRSRLLIVDVQERLLPHIAGHDRLVARIACLARAARLLELPGVVSEQYVRGLGPTTEALEEPLRGLPRFEKAAFSVWGDERLRAALSADDRPCVLVAGIETHVCVAQTVLDLVAAGLSPFVLADAVGARRRLDHRVALTRLAAAGATVTTTEAAIFELVEVSGTERFKRILPLVKEL